MKNTPLALIVSCLLAIPVCAADPAAAGGVFQDKFEVDKSELSSTGKNPYFVLIPGHQLVLEGTEHGKATTLTITVLKETKVVDGVKTRVVEEKEVIDGQPEEISRNYFAISSRTNDLFYFGEDVDMYQKGKVTGHDGSWLSGVAGARFGLMLPGKPVVGARFYNELAPKVAMDRAEIVSLDETLETPAGKFEHCLKTRETTPLESGRQHKLYAPGIGVIQDGNLKLVRHGR